MSLAIFQSQSGIPSLRHSGPHGDNALEDLLDPREGAEVFVSGAKLEGIDHLVLFGFGLGYRIERLLENEITPVVFEPHEDVMAFARQHGPEISEKVSVFTDLAELHRHLLSISRPDERTLLMVPPAYSRAFPEEHARVHALIQEVQGLLILQRNSVQERAALLTERVLTNLHRLKEAPTLDRLDLPLMGKPAFIVAAGPSLDKNRHLLADASKRGAVFAVNTSAPVFAAIDAPIDVLVAIEALDVSEPMALAAHVTRALALDITSGGPNFDVDVDAKFSFLVDTPQFHPLAQALGISTLGYGGSVATAAFSLAAALGADPIVLIGQDLAYTGGQGYASDTLFEQTKVIRHGDVLVIERVAKWDEMTRAGGLKVPSKARPCVEVPAWGGGTVNSTHELVHFRRWFEMAGQALRGRRRLINATEGGSHIEGFEEVALAELLQSLPETEHGLHRAIDEATPLQPERIKKAAQQMASGANALAKAADRCLKAIARGKSSAIVKAEQDVRAKALECPLAEAHAASSLLEIMGDKSLSAARRQRATFEAIARSARRIASLGKRAAVQATAENKIDRPEQASSEGSKTSTEQVIQAP